MSDDAYQAVVKEAWSEIRGWRTLLEQEIREGRITDMEQLDEQVREIADGATDYTSDHYLFAWGLPDADDDADVERFQSFETALRLRAYQNVVDAIMGSNDWYGFIDSEKTAQLELDEETQRIMADVEKEKET